MKIYDIKELKTPEEKRIVVGCSLYPGKVYDMEIEDDDVSDGSRVYIVMTRSVIKAIAIIDKDFLLAQLVSYEKGCGKLLMSGVIERYKELTLYTKNDLINYYKQFGFVSRSSENTSGYVRMKYKRK